MPVQTRSMLKKQYTDNIATPEPMKSTKTHDAPKKQKENSIKFEEVQNSITEREFKNYAVDCINKINNSRHNEKFTHYLKLCKYNLNNLKNVTFADTFQKRSIIEIIILKCKEFDRAIDEGVYDNLKYGLIKECNEYNSKLKELCYALCKKSSEIN